MLDFVEAVLQTGGWITIENPFTSLLFCMPEILEGIQSGKWNLVYMDQCCHGLRSPLGVTPQEIWKKPTYFLVTSDCFNQLKVRCQGNHTHTPVLGKVKVFGKSCARSMLAGRYPELLANRYASCALAHHRLEGYGPDQKSP